MEQERSEDEPKSRVLIVDSLNTFLRSFVAVGHINTAGNHIGGLGGFLKSVGAVVKQLLPTRVILVFDGHGGSTNKRYLYPDYKANRHIVKVSNWDVFDNQQEESDAITSQVIRLVEYLKCLPVDIIMIDKIEADDVIGYLSKQFTDRVYILSTDQDYLQLVSDVVQVYSPVKKIIYTPTRVLKEYGVPSHNFLTHKILVGDKGDNVPGVKGVQTKTLLKLFPKIASEDKISLENILEESQSKSGKYSDIYNYRHQLQINQKLMDLHNPNIPEEDRELLDYLVANPNKQYNPSNFLKLHREDQLDKTLSNPHLWLSETFARLAKG